MGVFIDQFWNIKHLRDGRIIYEEKDKKNILVDEGEKAILDVFYRKNDTLYFSADFFYVGLFRGTIIESSLLSTIPNEPGGNGYNRAAVERSSVGWPTIEKDNDDWRVVSKEITFRASGGNIGPAGGAFICTSLDASGVLLGAVSFSAEQTIKPGDQLIVEIKPKQK